MGTNGILKNSNFYNNYAFNSAGAVLWNAHKGTNGFLTNCTFVGNHGVHVGAVMWAMLNANGGKLTNCTFINNTADGGGGAIDWCSNKEIYQIVISSTIRQVTGMVVLLKFVVMNV